MPTPFVVPIRVRYFEVDLQGHVFNAHFLTWFDIAYGELIAAAGGRPYSALIADGIDVVVAEVGIRYLAPAQFDDELQIEIEVQPLTNTSMTSHFTVKRGEVEVAKAFVRHVCFDLNARTKRPWPDEIRAGIEPYVVAAHA
jgi:acyl-CoA thioester hydrolase